jgi:signal transduction histidine kinase
MSEADPRVGQATADRTADRDEVERLRGELAASRARFRSIIQRTVDGILVVDDEDGVILFANAAAGRLFGREPTDLVGSPFGFPLVVGESTEIDLVRDGETRVAELRVVETEWDGEPARIASLRDITDRKEAEEKARELVRQQAARAEAEEQARRAGFLAEAAHRLSSSLALEKTLQNAVDLVIEELADYAVIDLVEGEESRRFAASREEGLEVEMSAAAWHGLDTHADTPQARAFREREPILVREVDEEWIRSAAQDDEHLELLRSLGPRSVLFAPIYAGRECMGLLSAVRTTARPFRQADLHLLTELGRHAAMALENARLYRDSQAASEAKTNFLSVMSHELRTPLSAIIGYADLLDRGVAGETTEQQSEYLGRIRASSNHLLQILEEILAFAGAEAGNDAVEPAELNMDDLIDGVRAVADPLAADTELELRIAVDDGDARLHTDERKVRQILLNLVSNGLKFTESGWVELRARTEGDRAIFEVEDTGVGIPADQQDRIFERFSQVEEPLTRNSGGTGLGLSVAHRFATLLDGTLAVESEPGTGSTFTLDIPRSVTG